MSYQHRFLKKCYTYTNTRHRGFSLLIAVLIISAITVSTVLVVMVLGIGTSRSGFVFEQSYQAKNLGQACAEEALQQIRDATSFTGTGSLTLGQGTCTYTVTSQGGQNRTITATGTVGTVVQKVNVIIYMIDPTILAASWQEVADF
jgi:nitrogen fixation protein FixH